MPTRRTAVLSAWLFLLALGSFTGCQHPGGADWEVHRLYFGRAMPEGREVADAEWQTFLDEVIAVAFPQGFTVYGADGGWLSPERELIRESTWVLEVLAPRRPSVRPAVMAVAEAYRERFAQTSVLYTHHFLKGEFLERDPGIRSAP